MNQTYLDTARLLTQVVPLVFPDDTFVLKGSTAINLFVRDMLRLSVDLDLVFPDHTLSRDEALARINEALRQAAERLRKRGFQAHAPAADAGEAKLLVRRGRIEITLDTKRDTPTELRNFERQHQIHDPRWIVARASANDVRLVAAVLSIRYRQLPDHSFNHSAVISLADRDGVVRATALGVQAADASFMATVQSLSAAGSANRSPDE